MGDNHITHETPVCLQPYRIPMWIIIDISHQSRPHRIGHNIPGHGLQIFFLANRMVVISFLENRPAYPFTGQRFPRPEQFSQDISPHRAASSNGDDPASLQNKGLR